MFLRRRGTIAKAIVAVILFWTGTVLYLAVHHRQTQYDDFEQSDEDDPLGILARQRAVSAYRGVDGSIHTAFRPILELLDANKFDADSRAKLDAEHHMQAQFQWEQKQLERLLSAKTNYSIARGFKNDDALRRLPEGMVLDKDVETLVRKGLIVPKWNIDREVPEIPGAPGMHWHLCFCRYHLREYL